jgi:hypothetical protein
MYALEASDDSLAFLFPLCRESIFLALSKSAARTCADFRQATKSLHFFLAAGMQAQNLPLVTSPGWQGNLSD